MAREATARKLETLGAPTNGGAEAIEFSTPYVARVTIEGVAPLLFRAWNCEEVDSKGKAAKGSAAKKTDNLETCVFRNTKGEICIPGEYLRMSLVNAAKYRQDPRSSRKSAMDMCKAGIISLTELASLGTKEWDYVDRRRAVIHGAAINRSRPAFKKGWRATFDLEIILPEYIDRTFLQGLLTDAGRLIGVGDFRPSYGRFTVVKFDVILPT